MADYKLYAGGVIRERDGARIPESTTNRDWRRYLVWIAEGNTPDPADPAPVPPTDAELIDADMLNNPFVRGLIREIANNRGVTPAQYVASIKARA